MKSNISLFQSLVLTCLIGIFILLFRFLADVNKIEKVNEAGFFYKMQNDFFILDSNNRGLIRALGENQPILKQNGGKYDEYIIDDYLSHFDLLKVFLDEGLVPEKEIYETYNYYIVQAYQNKEIWGMLLN